MDTVEKKPQHPKDPDYFEKNYQNTNKGVMMQCPRCHRQTSKVNLSKHMKRDMCIKIFVKEMTLEIVNKLGLKPDTENNLNLNNDLNI